MNHFLLGCEEFSILGALLSDQWEGIFLIDPRQATMLALQAASIDQSTINERIQRHREAVKEQIGAMDGSPSSGSYELDGGIAKVRIEGAISKHGSSFSSAGSSVAAKHAMRKAGHDSKVKGILLNIESPGGAWAGTSELNQEVAKVSAIKPVYVAGEDMVASGGYLAATSATKIFMNDPGVVGSIGVYSTIPDLSGAYEKSGVKVHLLKFGRNKGIGTPGIPITDQQLQVLQKRIDEIGAMFIEQVAAGRRKPVSQVESWATGETYSAREGLGMQMIDAIGTPEEALAALIDAVNGKTTVSVPGKKTMNHSQIVALCDGLDKNNIAHKGFIADQLEKGDTLTELSVVKDWGKFQVEQAKLDAKAAEELRLAAEKKAALAQQEADDSKAKLTAAPGSHKPVGGEGAKVNDEQGDADVSATTGLHPFVVAVRELQKTGLSQQDATKQVAIEQPELHKSFVYSASAVGGKPPKGYRFKSKIREQDGE